MAGTAGYSGVVRLGSAATPTDDVGGCNSVTFNNSGAPLDVTEFGDTNVDRIIGLLDSGVTVAGHADYANTAQNTARANVLARTTTYVRILGDGTNGYEFTCKLTNYQESNSPDGTITFSVECVGIAAVTTVP